MRLTLIISLCVSSLLSVAQDNLIDSLKLALKNAKHDTTRCYILNQLAESASDEEWPAYNDTLKKLAEKNSQKCTPGSGACKIYLRYLANAVNNTGFLANQKGNSDSAFSLYGRCLKLYEQIGEKHGAAYTSINISLILSARGKMQEALNYLKSSLKILEQFDDKSGTAVCLNNMAGIYANQGDIEQALQCYDRSLKIREAIKDAPGIANSFNSLGHLYSGQNDNAKALEYYEKSLAIREKIGDKYGQSTTLSNIGIQYEKNSDLKTAMECYERCLKLSREIGFAEIQATALNNIGGCYYKQRQYNRSLEYYLESLQIRKKIQDKEGMAYSLRNIAESYYETGNNSKALKYALQALQVSREMGYPEIIRNSAHTLSKIYKRTGNHKKALENYELCILMRDSINNEKNKKASIKSQLKYEYEKRASADSIKNAEAQKIKDVQFRLQAAKLKQEKTQFWFLVSGLVAVGLGFIVVINRFRVTKRQKKIIEEQKKKVDVAYEELHEKNKEVMDSIFYARRIQKALITSERYISNQLRRLN